MPTILRSGPYRVYYHSHQTDEPPHVHVDCDAMSAKLRLAPVELVINLGFGATALRAMIRLLSEHEDVLLEEWNESSRSRRE